VYLYRERKGEEGREQNGNRRGGRGEEGEGKEESGEREFAVCPRKKTEKSAPMLRG